MASSSTRWGTFTFWRSATTESASSATATTTLAIIEQGTKVFSAIHKRIYRSLKGELNILRLWNTRTLDEERYGKVIDTQISKSDFDSDDYDFVPVADPEVATDGLRLGRAEFLLGFRGDENVDQEQILKRAFEAARIERPEELIKKPSEELQKQQLELQKQQQDMQQEAQRQEGVKQQLAEREQARKERDTEIKALESSVKQLELKTRAIDNLASAEAREEGQQLASYKANMEMLNDHERRILELAQTPGDGMGVQQAKPPQGNAQGAVGPRLVSGPGV